MNKKILIPVLLLSLAGFAAFQITPRTFDVLTQMKMLSIATTNAQQSMSELEQAIITTRNSISDMESKRKALTEERNILLQNAIVSSGCLSIIQAASESGDYTGELFGVPYFCPAANPNQPTSEAPKVKLDNEIARLNPLIVPLNAQINQLNRSISELREKLRVLLEQQAAQASQPTSGGTTNDGMDNEPTSDETGSLNGDMSSFSADEQLLNTFYPATTEETVAERAEYLHTVAMHASADPVMELQGPNGPVLANVKDGTITLTEAVELSAGQSIEIPQLGLSISNRNTTESARSGLLFGLIPFTQAQFGPESTSIPLIGTNQTLNIHSTYDQPYAVSANAFEIHILGDDFSFVTKYTVSSSGVVTLVPGGDLVSREDSLYGSAEKSSSVVFGTPDFFTNISNPPSSCSVLPKVTSFVDICIEECVNSTVEICLECVAPLEQRTCKTTGVQQFCEEACRQTEPAEETILDEIEKEAIVIC
jgi:hypothetical protein